MGFYSTELSSPEEASWGGGREFSIPSTVSTELPFILPIYPFPGFSALSLAFMSLKKEPKPQNRAIEPNLQRLKVAQLSEEIALGSGPWNSIWKERESGPAFTLRPPREKAEVSSFHGMLTDSKRNKLQLSQMDQLITWNLQSTIQKIT